MSHMYENESPQGYYSEEEERCSQTSLEDQDFQRYRDHVISEENYDVAPVYYNDLAPEKENADAPVNSIDAAHNTRRNVLDGCVNRYHFLYIADLKNCWFEKDTF